MNNNVNQRTTLGERIIALLTEKNIKPIDFADLLGVYEETINDWKYDIKSPTISQVVKISEYLNVSCDYLLKGEKENDINVKCPVCGNEINVKIP